MAQLLATSEPVLSWSERRNDDPLAVTFSVADDAIEDLLAMAILPTGDVSRRNRVIPSHEVLNALYTGLDQALDETRATLGEFAEPGNAPRLPGTGFRTRLRAGMPPAFLTPSCQRTANPPVSLPQRFLHGFDATSVRPDRTGLDKSAHRPPCRSNALGVCNSESTIPSPPLRSWQVMITLDA